MDNQDFHVVQLSVAISAPPLRPNNDYEAEVAGTRGRNVERGRTSFGIGRRPPQLEQRLRMSLIPTVVRHNFMATKDKEAKQEKSSTDTSASSSKATPLDAEEKSRSAPRKSNEDFRKMLLK